MGVVLKERNLATHLIEARSFRVALACCHNFWVLKNANGHTLAELHGLAYDRITRKILPIGTTKNHSLRVFVFAHDQSYAAMLGVPVDSTRMYARSRARVVYQGEDALARWNAALEAMPLLNRLDLTYPPFGFNVRTPTVNSNSAYRTFGEIMGVPVPQFGRVLGPGLGSRMLSAQELRRLSFGEQTA
ncbi:MAG: hypothetical protein JWM26_185 [Betaproteobacteria bacterium]|nr:hypothetical protein [Betaproteobacteria bacterium]